MTKPDDKTSIKKVTKLRSIKWVHLETRPINVWRENNLETQDMHKHTA